MSDQPQLRQDLRTLIGQAGMSQSQAAAALRVSQRTVEYWLSGDERHPVPHVAVLAMRWVVHQQRPAGRARRQP
jgi:DNA-binding transcriptional regulator YiaG